MKDNSTDILIDAIFEAEPQRDVLASLGIEIEAMDFKKISPNRSFVQDQMKASPDAVLWGYSVQKIRKPGQEDAPNYGAIAGVFKNVKNKYKDVEIGYPSYIRTMQDAVLFGMAAARSGWMPGKPINYGGAGSIFKAYKKKFLEQSEGTEETEE